MDMNTLSLKLMILEGLSNTTYDTTESRMEAMNTIFDWLMEETTEKKNQPAQLELFTNKDYDA